MAATNFGGPLILLLLALLLRSKLHEVHQSITESTTHHKRNFRGFELSSTVVGSIALSEFKKRKPSAILVQPCRVMVFSCLLLKSGDISPNPGPAKEQCKREKRTCTECGRVVARNHRATQCDGCSMWTHIKCGGVSSKEYRTMKSTEDFSHTCKSCCELLYQLPFADASLNSSSSTLCSNLDEEDDNSVWDEFDSIARNYGKNFKIGYVNANSIGDFKF